MSLCIFSLQMGSKCCHPEGGQQKRLPTLPKGELPLDNKAIYISAAEEVINLLRDPLDVSSLPKTKQFGKNSLILTIGGHFDPKLYVRFYLIYSFYISKYSAKDQKANQQHYETIFYKLASMTHPDEEEQKKVEQFKQEYAKQKTDLKKNIVVVSYLFKAKFIIENINQLLLKTDSPKDIAHLTFPLSCIYHAISKNYSMNKRPSQNAIYIVTAVQQQQREFITKMKGRKCCFAFSIFMKGFTVEKHARNKFSKLKKQYKNQKPIFFFTVNFPNTADKLDPKLDYGYYINPDPSTKEEGDVIFNLMNTFKVVESFGETEYDLQYGYLSALFMRDRIERIKDNQDANSIRVYDICNAISQHYLKSQSCLFRIINEGDVSLKVSRTVISQSHTKTAQNTLPSEVEAENLINNYIDENRYEEAIEVADKYSQNNLLKAKKLEILYKNGKIDEAFNMLPSITQECQPVISQATEIRNFIEALIYEKRNEKVKALALLRTLSNYMIAKYDAAFEVIGTDVITAIERVTGREGLLEKQKDLFLSQAENQKAIKESAINLRGISTSI